MTTKKIIIIVLFLSNGFVFTQYFGYGSTPWTEHNKRRKLINILTISTIITVTVMTVSLLCIQSGQADISVSVVPVNHTKSAGGQTELYSSDVLVATTSRTTVSKMSVADRPAEKNQDELITTFRGLQTPEVTRQSKLKDYSTSQLLRVNSSRSLDKDSFEVTPSILNTSNVTMQSLVIAMKNLSVNKNNLYPTTQQFYDSNMTIDNGDGKYELKEIEANNREVKHNKMVHDDQSMAETNNIMTKNRASTGHLKLYDLPYKMHDYSKREDDISANGIGWNTIDEPKNTHPVTPWAGGTDIWDHPSHETANVGYGYHSLPNRVTKDHRRPIQQKENKIDWHTIGTLAFIKLGLVKLQAIGFLNTLFLIVFKLKMYMTAIFVKFFLIMKLMKLSKILILPLLILQLLPTLMGLLSMRQLNNNNNNNNPGNILPNGNTGTLRPGGTTGTGLTGGTTGTGLTGGTTGTGLLGGTTGTGLPGGTTGAIRPIGTTRLDQTKRLSSFKFEDLNVTSKQHNESLVLFDPTWEIFQKILDSEKCIERIACQISVAEKAGVMPFWINWIVYHVSTFIPSDKLVSYLKTYKHVNNDILNNSTSSVNWTTWCLERYKCNSNISNTVNIE